MTIKGLSHLLFFFLFAVSIQADFKFENKTLGISIQLPDNWVANTVNDSQVSFSDKSQQYKSKIFIKSHRINKNDYPSASSWTRAHFTTYLLVVQYSYDPFGTTQFFDSSSSARLDNIWAPEAFSKYYYTDNNNGGGAWEEYIRYTESSVFGYDIYALGDDTLDMEKNITTYMQIINTIKIADNSAAISNNFEILNNSFKRLQTSSFSYNLLGKRVRSKIPNSNNVYYIPSEKSLRVNIK